MTGTTTIIYYPSGRRFIYAGKPDAIPVFRSEPPKNSDHWEIELKAKMRQTPMAGQEGTTITVIIKGKRYRFYLKSNT